MRPSRAALAAVHAVVLAAAGCTPEIPPARCAWGPPAAGHEAPASQNAASGGAGAPPGYRYHVASGPGAEQLCVQVDLPRDAPAPRVWTADPALKPFLRDVAFLRGDAFVPAPADPNGWLVPGCGAASSGGPPCRLRYRLLLGDAARALADFDRAMERDGALLSPPSAWLLRPREVHAPFVLTVATAPGESFISGLALAAAPAAAFGAGALTRTPPLAFGGDVGSLDESPYSAFGAFPVTRKRVGGGLVDLAFFRGKPSPAVVNWIDRALDAVTAYYQRFPIEHAALGVRIGPGRGVDGGHTMGDGGGAVLITVGEDTDAAGLAKDWMLVHELVHVSFPDVSTPWVEEGLATYLEPVIRVRSGLCDVDELWRSLYEGLPQGQPGAGDGGLDVTDTWGRRYWGGAMFWLLADVEIRKRSGNARSLDDALLAVNRAGGNVAQRWDLDRVLALADGGAGAEVLGPLRRQMGKAPVRVDLDALWKSLGVAEVGGAMVYDDAAPLASVRKGILTGKRAGTP